MNKKIPTITENDHDHKPTWCWSDWQFGMGWRDAGWLASRGVARLA